VNHTPTVVDRIGTEGELAQANMWSMAMTRTTHRCSVSTASHSSCTYNCYTAIHVSFARLFGAVLPQESFSDMRNKAFTRNEAFTTSRIRDCAGLPTTLNMMAVAHTHMPVRGVRITSFLLDVAQV
jgi:hypothetical protein